jgi:hypothetical protein
LEGSVTSIFRVRNQPSKKPVCSKQAAKQKQTEYMALYPRMATFITSTDLPSLAMGAAGTYEKFSALFYSRD